MKSDTYNICRKRLHKGLTNLNKKDIVDPRFHALFLAYFVGKMGLDWDDVEYFSLSFQIHQPWGHLLNKWGKNGDGKGWGKSISTRNLNGHLLSWGLRRSATLTEEGFLFAEELTKLAGVSHLVKEKKVAPRCDICKCRLTKGTSCNKHVPLL